MVLVLIVEGRPKYGASSFHLGVRKYLRVACEFGAGMQKCRKQGFTYSAIVFSSPCFRKVDLLIGFLCRRL